MDIAVGLVRRCKENDREAFNQLFARYEGFLYKICYSYTHSKEDALDVMQEVYVKIFRSMHRFDETMPLMPWMKKVAVNTSLNWIRDQQRQQKKQLLSLDDRGEDALALLEKVPSDENVEEVAIFNHNQSMIATCLSELPENYRTVLSLRFIAELSYDEIATTTNQPLGTVKNGIYRARELLKKKMEKYGMMEV